MITRKFILDQELNNYSNNELKLINNAAEIISGLLPIRACSVLILLCILHPPLPLVTGKGLFVFPYPGGLASPDLRLLSN